jgi:hypothetical protein
MWKRYRLQQTDDGKGGGGGGEGTPAPAWFGNEANKALVESKGFKGVDDVFTWGQNAEKLIGADRAGRTIVLPKDDKDAEGIKAFRTKLGVPEKADDYGLPVPEGGDPAFAKTASAWFHESGVPKDAALKIATKWNEHLKSQMDAIDKQLADNSAKELGELKTKWGDKAQANEEHARRFMKAIGWNDDQVKKFEGAMGTAFMLEHFNSLGQKMGEAGFLKGDGQGGGGVTKDQAKAKVAELNAARTAGTITAAEFQTQIEKYGPIANAA